MKSPSNAESIVYLDPKNLSPGDVILSRGKAAESKAIAIFSGGTYSHAALVLDSGSLFEADEYGVGFTTISKVLVRAAGELRTWWKYSDVEQVAILRHPDLANRYVDKIGPKGLRLYDAVRKATTPFLGQPYSHLGRLAKASVIPEPYRPIFSRILRWCDGRNAASCVPGLFCSELIVKTYDDLGVCLFDASRSADVISPNDLSQSPCTLSSQIVEGALVKEQEVKDSEVVAEIPLVGLTRGKYLPDLVSFVEGASIFERGLEKISNSVEFQLASNDNVPAKIESDIRELIENCSNNMRHDLRRELEEALGEIQKSIPLAQRWMKDSDNCGREELDAYVRVLINQSRAVLLYAEGILEAENELSTEIGRNVDAIIEQVKIQNDNVDVLYKCFDERQAGRKCEQMQQIFEFNDVELPVERFNELESFLSFRTTEMMAVLTDEVLEKVMVSDAVECGLEKVGERKEWLRSNIEVSFPDANLMRIGVRGLPRDALRPLVDALTNAYRLDVRCRADRDLTKNEQLKAEGKALAEKLIVALKLSGSLQ